MNYKIIELDDKWEFPARELLWHIDMRKLLQSLEDVPSSTEALCMLPASKE